ncbi:hypothetical protein ACQUYR_03585 [Lentilactobacillus otakiensis]
MNELQINAVSSDNLFDVTTDSSTNPATITLTAKKGLDYSHLANAGASIYMKPATSDYNQKTTIDYPVSVEYIRGTQSAKIDDNTLKVNNVPGTDGGGQEKTIGLQIFGGLGGLPFPTGYNGAGEDRWNANFYAEAPEISNPTDYDSNLLYWYSQNATVGWAQITLPSDSASVPSSLTWTITAPESNPFIDPQSVQVYREGNNDDPADRGKWKLYSSSPTKMVFKLTNLDSSDAGKNFNIPFAVKTKSVQDKFIVTSNISDISNNLEVKHRKVQMMYNSTIGLGFIPVLNVKELTMTLSEARELLFNNNSEVLKDQATLLGEFATATDNNDEHTTNILHFGNGYDYTSALAYDQIKADQTYSIPIYASNENGSGPTKYAKLTITPDTDQLSKLNAEFIDVDGQTTFRKITLQ